MRTDELRWPGLHSCSLHGLSLDRSGDITSRRTEGGRGPSTRRAGITGERDPARFVTDTVQSDSIMSEYLMQEVLERLPGDLQRFVLRTSVAQPLTVELAEVLSEDPAAEAQLAQLEHTGVFVTRADQPVAQYRFHSLFGALLHARLRHSEPELARELSGRAALWFSQHDMPAEAEVHALAARDWRLGGRLACNRWVHNVLHGSTAGIDVDLPLGAPRSDVAELALLAAIDATTGGDRRNATMWGSRVDTLLNPDDSDPELRIARLLVEVFHGRAFGVDARAISACRALRDLEIGADTASCGRATAKAELLLETDDDEATLRALLDARWRGSRNAAPWVVEECDAIIGLIAAVQGRLDACDALILPISECAVDGADTRRLARALCDAQRGRVQSARAILDAGGPAVSAPHAVRIGLEEAGRRVQLSPDSASRAPADRSPFATSVRTALGSIEDARSGTAESHVATARALLSRNRYAQVVELLKRLALGRDPRCTCARIEALTLMAIAADRAEDPVSALSALRRALDLAPVDLRAPFLTYAVLFREVIDRYAWRLAGETRYAVDLVDDLHRDEPPAFVEPLTERERAVLDYLPTMMSNGEIAQQLLVSVNTVKTHLKAVYRKLGVERRRDAVVRARQLELL